MIEPEQVYVGFSGDGRVWVQLAPDFHFTLSAQNAMWVARHLMRCALILEPDAETPPVVPGAAK